MFRPINCRMRLVHCDGLSFSSESIFAQRLRKSIIKLQYSAPRNAFGSNAKYLQFAFNGVKDEKSALSSFKIKGIAIVLVLRICACVCENAASLFGLVS